jgi:hypothetical protein
VTSPPTTVGRNHFRSNEFLERIVTSKERGGVESTTGKSVQILPVEVVPSGQILQEILPATSFGGSERRTRSKGERRALVSCIVKEEQQ